MSGLIPDSFIEELLARSDIVELIERRVPLKRVGSEFQACCPFHDEKTPSFTVSPKKAVLPLLWLWRPRFSDWLPDAV